MHYTKKPHKNHFSRPFQWCYNGLNRLKFSFERLCHFPASIIFQNRFLRLQIVRNCCFTYVCEESCKKALHLGSDQQNRLIREVRLCKQGGPSNAVPPTMSESTF